MTISGGKRKMTNLGILVYNSHAALVELSEDGKSCLDIEEFNKDHVQIYVDEWFPDGIPIQNYINLSTQYATGGVIQRTKNIYSSIYAEQKNPF